MPARALHVVVVVALTASVCFAGGRNIHECARNGELSKVKSYVQKDPQAVHARDDKQYTPLHWASDWGQKDVVEYLLSKGADPNARASSGWTPIQAAEASDHREVARILRTAAKNRPAPRPAAPAIPAAPVIPAAPAAPAMPTYPTTPAAPAIPTTPTYPVNPTLPQQPQMSTSVGTSGVGGIPGQALPSTPPRMTGNVMNDLVAAKQHYDREQASFAAIQAQYNAAAARMQQAQQLLQYAHNAYVRANGGVPAAPAAAAQPTYNPQPVAPAQPAMTARPAAAPAAQPTNAVQNANQTVSETAQTIEQVNALINLFGNKK